MTPALLHDVPDRHPMLRDHVVGDLLVVLGADKHQLWNGRPPERTAKGKAAK